VKELKKVVLIGPMGAGKSTLGKEAARVLGWQYFDNDAEMSLRYGFTQDQLSSMSVPELHQLESRYLADVIAQDAPFISGAAASVVDYELNRKLLQEVNTIYLRIPLDAVISRAGTQGVGRQALAIGGAEILEERYLRRDPLYREVAAHTLELTQNQSGDTERLIKLLQQLS
jgi:shikimate kinase